MSVEFTESFGSALRRMRKSRSSRQVELAVEIPVDHSLISRWETGAALPTLKDLERIERCLRLDDNEAEQLFYAWRRDAESIRSLDRRQETTWSTELLVEALHLSIDSVRSLRKSGQPRLAMALGHRDAGVAFRHLRSVSWTSAHGEALRLVTELLLEECKAGLDYLPRDAVRRGDLAVALRVQRMAANAAAAASSRAYVGIAREGVAYVAGNLGDAHDLGRALLDEAGTIPAEWIPEVVRASAINAGALGDAETLRRTEGALQAMLEDGPGLPAGTHAFVLEGMARGWAPVEPKSALRCIERAWGLRRQSDDVEAHSSLRYVQLARSQARVELALGGSSNAGDTARKIQKALDLSRMKAYDRYVTELSALQARF